MTIKTRNRFFVALFFFGIFLLLINFSFFLYAVFSDSVPIPDNLSASDILRHRRIPFSSNAVFSSILFYGIAAPVLSFCICRGFEKTATLEVLFFSGVIISCFLEQSRIIIPAFRLWDSSSLLLITTGRLLTTGRILLPLSLFFATIFSSNDQLENSERNLFLLFALSCVFGFFYPENSARVTTSFSVSHGMKFLFNAISFFTIAVTVFSISLNALIKSNSVGHLKSLGIILLYAGFLILSVCDSMIYFTAGALLFSLGSFVYLKQMHYMASNWD